MIVNVRGTSGSGKTHLIKRLMAAYDKCEPLFPEPTVDSLFGPTHDPRRQLRPRGYRCVTGARDCRVLGPYDQIKCGCDVLMSNYNETRDSIAATIRALDSAGLDVLYEGLLISDVERVVSFAKEKRQVLVVALDVPLEACLAAVEARRSAKAAALGPLSEKKTRDKYRETWAQMERLKIGRVDARALDREAAFQVCAQALGVTG